jgi:hypothetical protein
MVLNEKDSHDNKIVFQIFKNFNFDDIILSHEGQAVS